MKTSPDNIGTTMFTHTGTFAFGSRSSFSDIVTENKGVKIKVATVRRHNANEK